MRTRVDRWRSIAVLLLGLVLWGCTSGPSSTGPEPTSPYRQTLEEYLITLAACMREQGYNATVDEGGLLVDGVFDRDRAMADQRACQEQIDPARLQPPPKKTRAQLEAMYRYVVAQTVCMREAGYPVSDPPPLQVYVDSEGAAFDPYGDLRLRGIGFSHEDLIRCQGVEERPDFFDW
jgi:hypothetical protein